MDPSKLTVVSTQPGLNCEVKSAVGNSLTVIVCSKDFEHPLSEVHVSLIFQSPAFEKECVKVEAPVPIGLNCPVTPPITSAVSHFQVTIS